MTPLAPSLEFLSELVGGSDGLIRLAVGAAGAAVGMAGARLYHVTLAVGGFLVGCLGTLALVGDSLDPRTALGLSLVIGVLLSALSGVVQLLGLAFLGGWVGASAAPVIWAAASTTVPEWAPWLGGAVGMALAPGLFKAALPVITSAAGALLVAWAGGLDAWWVVLGLFCLFSTIQQLASRRKGKKA